MRCRPTALRFEIALAVADEMHGRGTATLLLEHLVSVARARGVKTFVAEVLPDNYPVLPTIAVAQQRPITWSRAAPARPGGGQ